jgi:FkbM family methyltransferase
MLLKDAFGSAVVIEPDPENFRLLEKNIVHNSLSERVKAYQFACSDRKDRLAFELSVSNMGDHRIRLAAPDDKVTSSFDESRRKVIFVESIPIDELFSKSSERIGCVWMDVQGHEGYVIKGGPQVFGASPPTAIEFWPYGIMRSGMDKEQFFAILGQYWSGYYDLQEKNPKLRGLECLKESWEKMTGPGTYANHLLVK